MTQIRVPVCNICGKPHYGRSKSEDRCWCDFSGQFHYEYIEAEEEKEMKQKSKRER
jgi:hypothetical protein